MALGTEEDSNMKAMDVVAKKQGTNVFTKDSLLPIASAGIAGAIAGRVLIGVPYTWDVAVYGGLLGSLGYLGGDVIFQVFQGSTDPFFSLKNIGKEVLLGTGLAGLTGAALSVLHLDLYSPPGLFRNFAYGAVGYAGSKFLQAYMPF